MSELEPTTEPTADAVPDAAATSPEAPPPAAPAELGPQGWQRFWLEWARPLIVVLAVMLSFRSAFADWNNVPSGSMRPTIIEGDRIFVNKAAYGLRFPFTRLRLVDWAEPERGDIVVLFSPEDGKRLVKRVVGLPGDRIEMHQDRLSINGQVVSYRALDPAGVTSLGPEERDHFLFYDEDLGQHPHWLMLPESGYGRSSIPPQAIPAGHYFVMGDNRSNSRDSRYFGLVERSRIVGKATYVAFSFDWSEGFPPVPRWSRSFVPLR